MQVTLKIKRYNPERDLEPHWESYEVEAEPTDRVLDLLPLFNRHPLAMQNQPFDARSLQEVNDIFSGKLV